MRYCSPGNVAIIESLHRRKGSSADKFRKMHICIPQTPSKQSLKEIAFGNIIVDHAESLMI